MLSKQFFAKDAQQLAKELLGKIIFARYNNSCWLTAKIVETEAYYLTDRASHASLGYTEKRKALFMPAGTIYMYYARGGDSLNVSAQGEGNAVLIKAGIPYLEHDNAQPMLEIMHKLNPHKDKQQRRATHKLCAGQTLLCRSLNLQVPHWDKQQFNKNSFYIADVNYKPDKIIQTTRLGIPPGRDENLLYRFIDHAHATSATKNPLTMRSLSINKDFFIFS